MTKKWWAKSAPGKQPPIPWMCPEAITMLESLLKPEMRVLEHGSGGSTLWLAKRVKYVVTTEQHPRWFDAMQPKISKNTLLIFHTQAEPPEFEKMFDLMLIDGEPIATRARWIMAIPRLLKPGGYVVLDNANRPEYETERLWLAGKADLLTTVQDHECETASFFTTDFYRWKYAGAM